MSKQRFLLGIDGGGTRTSAEVWNRRGEAFAYAETGPSNMHSIGVDQAADAIVGLIRECTRQAGITPLQVEIIVAGLAGAGRASDQRRVARAIRLRARSKQQPIRRLVVESDARIALEGAFSGKRGIIAIAGTGSIAYGANESGKMARAGGWGRTIGDGGSGYAIGIEALRGVARILDGSGERSLLQALISRRFGLRTQEEIINAVYKNRFDVASLAPLVIRAAEKKDPIATKILRTCASDLANLVSLVAQKLQSGKGTKLKTFPVCVVGGLVSQENQYATYVRSALSARTRLKIQKPDASALHGAYLRACSYTS
jgi:glucosamine kinase